MNLAWITCTERHVTVVPDTDVGADGSLTNSQTHHAYAEWMWLNLFDHRRVRATIAGIDRVEAGDEQTMDAVREADVICVEVVERDWTHLIQVLREHARADTPLLCVWAAPIKYFLDREREWVVGPFDAMIWSGMPGEERVVESRVDMPVFACPPILTEAILDDERRRASTVHVDVPEDMGEALLFARPGRSAGDRSALHSLFVPRAYTDRPIYCVRPTPAEDDEMDAVLSGAGVRMLPYMPHDEWLHHCRAAFCLLDMIEVETVSRTTVAGYSGGTPTIGSHHVFLSMLFPELTLAWGHQGPQEFGERLRLVEVERDRLMRTAARRLRRFSPARLRPRFEEFMSAL